MRTYTTWSPAPIAGTLKFSKPISGLGRYTDVDGVTWEVRAIINGTINAAQVSSLQPWVTDTSGNDSQYFQGSMPGPRSQKYLPYKYEIVK